MDDGWSCWADDTTERNREEQTCQRTALWQIHYTESTSSTLVVVPNEIFLLTKAASFDKLDSDFLMCRASLGDQNFFRKQCCKRTATAFAQGKERGTQGYKEPSSPICPAMILLVAVIRQNSTYLTHSGSIQRIWNFDHIFKYFLKHMKISVVS